MDDKVESHPLALHADARGWLMELCDRQPIAYAYATACYPGVVKAWHRHSQHTDRLACVSGMARVVTCIATIKPHPQYPDAPDKYWLTVDRHSFQEFIIGPLSPALVVIPPGIWHGFTAVGNEPCVIVNCPDMPYDPEDEERLPIEAIPFGWREVSG